MPILIFLRHYGWREYAIVLIVAALVGLGIALLLNSAAGGAGSTGELKTKRELSVVSSAPRVTKPVAKAASAPRTHPARKRVHPARRHRSSRPAPAPVSVPRLTATRKTAPAPTPRPTYTPASTPKPAPVVQKPAPVPKPAPAPKKRSGGGSGQFDDSG
jgi:hypothetical protein